LWSALVKLYRGDTWGRESARGDQWAGWLHDYATARLHHMSVDFLLINSSLIPGELGHSDRIDIV